MAKTTVPIELSSTPSIVDNGNATAITIDSSQNVGIGTSIPSATLALDKSTGQQHRALDLENNSITYSMYVDQDNASTNSWSLFDTTNSQTALRYLPSSSGYWQFYTNNTERMRIDSSGTLLVGKSATTLSVAGVFIGASGSIGVTRASDDCLTLNRTGTDGAIITFYDDGTTVGTISTSSTGGGSIIIGNDSSGIMFRGDLTTSAFIPANPSTNVQVDNTLDVGHSAIRFDDIYATNATIQTSDRNEKNTIEDSDLGLDFINRLSPKSYIFNDKTRTHYGLIAQDVETVLSDISKTSQDFAGFIKSDISEEQDGSQYRYGLRYNEFIAPLIQAIKELKEKNDALEARIATLEGN